MEYQSTHVETEAALRVFADAERRRIVEMLVEHPENEVSLQELADELAPGPSPSGAPPGHGRTVISLEHDHLPRLDDVGIVSYDERRERVRYRPDDRVERLLEFINTELE